MAGSPRSEHSLVILRRGREGQLAVLLLRDGDGWALPRIESAERRSADVADLNRSVLEALGLEVSVLRCLADQPGTGDRPRQQSYLLEAHGVAARTAPGGEWIQMSALDAEVPAGSRVRRPLDAWRAGDTALRSGAATAFHPGAVLRDWARPGWRDEVLAWVAGHLARRGLPPIDAVEQLRVWEFSQVLRLGTAGPRLYLKARPAHGAAEVVLTQRLADRHPAWAPDVIAVEPGRRWLLMSETPGGNLMQANDPLLWEGAAAAIAHMQIDWLPATGELAALGCPRVPLTQIQGDIGPMLDDVAALRPRRGGTPCFENAGDLGEAAASYLPDGLTGEQVAALRRRRPELEALCRELDAEGIPESLEHGDLWGENAIAAGGGVILIDWEDASVAHPFFTPALLLLSLDHTDALAHVPDARRRIRDAYLAPWSERGPLARWPGRRLEQTFELARQVAMLHYARQFWRHALPMIETSWEVRGFAPSFLRRLLQPENAAGLGPG